MVICLEDLHTPTTLAEVFGVPANTVYTWVHGGMPHYKRGGLTLIIRHEAEEWLKNRKERRGRPKAKAE